MDLDGQGGMLLMDEYKWRGTEDGLEKQGIFGATRIHSSPSVSQSATIFQMCYVGRVFVTSTVKNIYLVL